MKQCTHKGTQMVEKKAAADIIHKLADDAIGGHREKNAFSDFRNMLEDSQRRFQLQPQGTEEYPWLIRLRMTDEQVELWNEIMYPSKLP